MSTVLLVEDDSRVAAIVARGLRRDGHELLLAEDGDLAAFLASTGEVDLVVLDMGLASQSGADALVSLRRSSTSPVVVLTPKDGPSDRAACLASGASTFLTKPFSVSALRAEVRGQLGRAAVQMEATG